MKGITAEQKKGNLEDIAMNSAVKPMPEEPKKQYLVRPEDLIRKQKIIPRRRERENKLYESSKGKDEINSGLHDRANTGSMLE